MLVYIYFRYSNKKMCVDSNRYYFIPWQINNILIGLLFILFLYVVPNMETIQAYIFMYILIHKKMHIFILTGMHRGVSRCSAFGELQLSTFCPHHSYRF